MLKHHRESLARAAAKLRANPRILAVILGGSLAHRYARRDSDIDLMIVVPDAEYRRRLRTGEISYWENQSCNYKGGYVDGKFTSPSFLHKVASRGSQPARYAFKDARVVFSRMKSLPALLRRIARFPAREREDMERRFLSQLEAWKWYYFEGLRLGNGYLRQVAASKVILFGCRLVLARNGVLYPYHKWMLKEVEMLKRRPRGFLPLVERILAGPNPRAVRRFHALVRRYAGATKPDHRWAARFMLDSELNWMDGKPPVDDL